VVLGRPGSGCSTFLKTLANCHGEFHAVKGEVHYDSFSPAEISRHYRGDVLYCPEDDILFSTLTVEQTLAFAAKTRTPQARVQYQTRPEFVRTTTDNIQTIFGLNHVTNTLIGGRGALGVSGGEKKRVSIGEALALRARIAAWDK